MFYVFASVKIGDISLCLFTLTILLRDAEIRVQSCTFPLLCFLPAAANV